MLRDFSDTVAFVKVVQEGSFTAAARVLKVPKTRISRKVHELEQRLRAQLLNRTTRSLKLTEAGTAYFRRCEAIVRDLEDAENAVAELQDHPRGWLRIAAPHWLGTRILPPLLSEFRRFYPDVYPQLLLGNDAVDLIAKDIDVAMRMWVGPMPDSSLTARQIGELPMGVYAAPSYLERNGTPQHPLDLADHDCLLIQHLFERSSIEWALTNGQERIDAIVRPVAVADDLEALYSFLVAGDGVLMTNHLRARHDLIEGRLVRILPDWQGPELVLYAVRPAGRMQPPKVTAFLDFIKPRLDLTAPFPS
jgi:DNA-binding transcriptional LysR family regulator